MTDFDQFVDKVFELNTNSSAKKPVETRKAVKKVQVKKEAPVKKEVPVEVCGESTVASDELNTSTVTEKTQQYWDDIFTNWAESIQKEQTPQFKLMRRGNHYDKVKKTYEKVPYTGTLKPYEPKPQKEKEDKKVKLSVKSGKGFNDRKIAMANAMANALANQSER